MTRFPAPRPAARIRPLLPIRRVAWALWLAVGLVCASATTAHAWKLPSLSDARKKIGDKVKVVTDPITEANKAIQNVKESVKEVASVRDSVVSIRENVESLLPAAGVNAPANETDDSNPTTRPAGLLDQTEHSLNLGDSFELWATILNPDLAPFYDISAEPGSGRGGFAQLLKRRKTETAAAFKQRALTESNTMYARIGAAIQNTSRFTCVKIQLGRASYSPEQQILSWKCPTEESTANASGRGIAGSSPKTTFSQQDGQLTITLSAPPRLANQILAAQKRLPTGQGEMTVDLTFAVELPEPRESRSLVVERVSGLDVVNVQVPMRLRIVEVQVFRNGVNLASLSAK